MALEENKNYSIKSLRLDFDFSCFKKKLFSIDNGIYLDSRWILGLDQQLQIWFGYLPFVIWFHGFMWSLKIILNCWKRPIFYRRFKRHYLCYSITWIYIQRKYCAYFLCTSLLRSNYNSSRILIFSEFNLMFRCNCDFPSIFIIN